MNSNLIPMPSCNNTPNCESGTGSDYQYQTHSTRKVVPGAHLTEGRRQDVERGQLVNQRQIYAEERK